MLRVLVFTLDLCIAFLFLSILHKNFDSVVEGSTIPISRGPIPRVGMVALFPVARSWDEPDNGVFLNIKISSARRAPISVVLPL